MHWESLGHMFFRMRDILTPWVSRDTCRMYTYKKTMDSCLLTQTIHRNIYDIFFGGCSIHTILFNFPQIGMFQNCWPTTLEGQILNLSRYFQVLRSPTPEQKVRHPGWRKYCTCLAARWHHGQVTSKDALLLALLRFLWACRRIVICILWSRILFRKTSVNWICSLQTNGTVLIQVLILWVSKFQVITGSVSGQKHWPPPEVSQLRTVKEPKKSMRRTLTLILQRPGP